MTSPTSKGGALAAVFVYGAAMGWLEAVVVIYIRNIVGLAHGRGMPSSPELVRMIGQHPWLLPVEQTREAATLIMLGAVGWMAARPLVGKIGAFLIAFGVWDLVYYVALAVLVGWPRSLGAIDVLFLLPPHPWWTQPVWVPASIASAMVVVGVVLARRG